MTITMTKVLQYELGRLREDSGENDRISKIT